VIEQARNYAQQLGTPFFATYNGDFLVLFKTYEKFRPFLETISKSYRITDVATFAEKFLSDLILLEQQKAKWDKPDDAFVSRLKQLHQRITRIYLPVLDKILLGTKTEEKIFTRDYEKWVKRQGFDVKNKAKEIEENFARQRSYLLLNQVLFYKILENEPSYRDDVTKLNPVLHSRDLPRRLCQYFRKIVRDVDFKAVFEPDPIFNRIPISNKMAEELNDFLGEFEKYDLTSFDSDIIGRIYEHLIPSTERHNLGQYYTPPVIVELITDLCIKNANDTILDPACGSGSFLVKAYRKIKELNPHKSHQDILNQIYGIDINQFPAHLSAINLSIQEITKKTNKVPIEIADFFDINVSQGRFARKMASITGEEIDESTPIPNTVRVIVANPPYIKQQKISDKQKTRKHLKKLKTILSQTSDIYAYFFTHSFEFLQDGGKIGFITSDRWLDTRYGEQLQKFFLNNFKIKSVIKFDKQAFETPLIGSAITILEKNNSVKERDENLVNLIRIKGHMNIEEIVGIAETTYKSDRMHDEKSYRIFTIKQEFLKNDTKWNRYLYAPDLYLELQGNSKLTQLIEVADIERGRTSGVNEFFYLKQEDIDAHGLDRSLFSPLMKAIAQAEFVDFKKNETEWLVLDLHHVIEKALHKSGKELIPRKDQTMAGFIKEKLHEAGYESLYRYINLGEERRYHKRPTCKTRNVWFDLGDLPRPLFIFPDVYWKKTSVPYNVDKVVIDKQLYTLSPKPDIDEMVLGGILNSDWLPLFRELNGRTIMGEGLNRNQVMVYEAKQIPIPDPRKFTAQQSKRIKSAFEKLLSKSRTVSEQELNEIKRELNKAVLVTLGLEERAEELEKVVKHLVEIRIQGGGIATEIMVEESKPKTIQVKRPTVTKGSLDEFL